MQIKTTLRCHYNLVKWLWLTILSIDKYVEQLESSYTTCGVYEMAKPHWKNRQFLKKLSVILSYDAAISLLGIYQKESKYPQEDLYMSVYEVSG